MAKGSFSSKRPPLLDIKPMVNRYVNENGATTYYASQPLEEMRGRWYQSLKTAGFKQKRSRELRPLAFQGGARVRSDPGGYAYQPYRKSDGTMSTRVWEGTARFMFPAIWEAMDTPRSSISWDSTPTKETAITSALTKCVNTKVNIAQSFAERKQTAGLLVNSINRFAMFAVALREGNLYTANRMLKRSKRYFEDREFGSLLTKVNRPTRDQFANWWLEYSYGWRPLLNDIYGAAELLAQQATETRPTVVVGTAKTRDRMSNRWTNYGVTAECVSEVDCIARCKLAFDIDDYEADLLKQTGISNPALLAWELVPYSFVVDWFVPVGNYLQNLAAASGLKFLWGSTSVKTRISAKSQHVSNIHGYVLSGYQVSEEFLVLDRYVHNAFPRPVLPKFQWGLNFNRGLSAVALINQVFRK